MSTNADGPVLKTQIEHIKIITTLLLLEEHDIIFLPNNSKEHFKLSQLHVDETKDDNFNASIAI